MAPRKTKKSENIHPVGKALTTLEQPDVIGRMIGILIVCCLLLFAGDFFYHRHSHFEAEAMPGFYGVFGFAAFAFIIFATKVLRFLIGRSEDYYGSKAVDSEEYPEKELSKKDFGDA